MFSLRAKSPAFEKAGAITSHYGNRETLLTSSAVIKSKNRKCVERHRVRSCGRSAGQAGFAALSAPLARNRKQSPESGSGAPVRIQEHLALSSRLSAPQLLAAFHDGSRQA